MDNDYESQHSATHRRGISNIQIVQQPISQPIPPVGARPNAAATHTGPFPVSRSIEKLDGSDTLSRPDSRRDFNDGRGRQPLPPLPSLPHARDAADGRVLRSRTLDTHVSAGQRSVIDWIVPVEEKAIHRTVGERLQPSLDMAYIERDKYAVKAKMTGYALNAAIGLQVLLGSLTTGLSVVTTGRQTSIMTTILGGLATITASYLARARGSNEPELSITRLKDLEQFIRESQAFQLDYGHISTAEFDEQLIGLRNRFEELLGYANDERKSSPPV